MTFGPLNDVTAIPLVQGYSTVHASSSPVVILVVISMVLKPVIFGKEIWCLPFTWFAKKKKSVIPADILQLIYIFV